MHVTTAGGEQVVRRAGRNRDNWQLLEDIPE